MRVIAGSLGGRLFDAPTGHRTHPMGEKITGALFNTLGDISGLSVLDAYAGSGALSFESISRGAKSVIAVEIDHNAQRTIKANIRSLGMNYSVKLISASINAWVGTNPESFFDVVLCDPPYDSEPLSQLIKLTDHVKPGGIMVLSWPGNKEIPQLGKMSIIDGHNYGDAQLIYYRE